VPKAKKTKVKMKAKAKAKTKAVAAINAKVSRGAALKRPARKRAR
jgi:hypothetical protein